MSPPTATQPAGFGPAGFGPMSPPTAAPTQPAQVVVITSPTFGPSPMTMAGPNCRANITTSTAAEPGAMAWILGALLCLCV